eukprot:2357616-Rhodomonas_salina.1
MGSRDELESQGGHTFTYRTLGAASSCESELLSVVSNQLEEKPELLSLALSSPLMSKQEDGRFSRLCDRTTNLHLQALSALTRVCDATSTSCRAVLTTAKSHWLRPGLELRRINSY